MLRAIPALRVLRAHRETPALKANVALRVLKAFRAKRENKARRGLVVKWARCSPPLFQARAWLAGLIMAVLIILPL